MNSMNLSDVRSSKNGDKIQTKLAAVLKGGADILCLQDLRLGVDHTDFTNQLLLTNFGSCNITSNIIQINYFSQVDVATTKQPWNTFIKRWWGCNIPDFDKIANIKMYVHL